MPPWMMPFIHSYKSDIAGVVRIIEVSGGRSFRTSRGSRGVKVANYKILAHSYKTSHICTDQLDQLNSHPIVPTVHKELK